MRRHDGLLGFISIVLVIAIFIGLGSVLARAGFREPENPLGDKAQPLIPEVLEGGGQMNGSEGENRDESTPPEDTQPSQDNTEPEEKEPPTQPPTEPENTEPPTEPATEPTDPEPGQNDNVGETEPGDNNGGNMDSGEEGNGDAGGDGNGPGEGGNTPGDGEDDSLKIVTNLESRFVTRLEIPDGILKFYAYPSIDDPALSIKVVVNNSATPMNGQVLESSDGKNYEAPLVLNETTTITLYLKQNGENVSYVRYQIRYEAEKADENNPEVGDNPPSIITNLDGFEGLMETQDFLFWVSARTNPEGEPIYSNQIEVWLNGELVPKQTGDARPEYELHFEPPNVGDYAEYTVKVRAWDGRGNSTMKIYTINYHTVSEGDYLGEVRLILDATTVGLGIIDSATYEIVQGDTAAGVVIKFLEEYGYDAVYDGSTTLGFYLRSISRGDMCYGARVPDRLWEMILRDGIQLSSPADRDSLGEYDFTMGSGWMYSINGSVYPGRGLSDYQLSSNTTIYLRFTLSYGKDIGGGGQGMGSLDSYCGVWINGGYTPLDHSFEVTDRLEPTETEDGYVIHTCTRCGETEEEVLPATGEATEPYEPEETAPPADPTDPEETEPTVPSEPTEPEPAEPPEPPVTGPPDAEESARPKDEEEESK